MSSCFYQVKFLQSVFTSIFTVVRKRFVPLHAPALTWPSTSDLTAPWITLLLIKLSIILIKEGWQVGWRTKSHLIRFITESKLRIFLRWRHSKLQYELHMLKNRIFGCSPISLFNKLPVSCLNCKYIEPDAPWSFRNKWYANIIFPESGVSVRQKVPTMYSLFMM